MKPGPRARPMSERLIEKSIPEPNTGCWLWLGTVLPLGYGTVSVPGHGKGFKRGAHVVSYETFVGPIPDGAEIDHKCRQPGCVNPRHLRAVTHKENLRAAPTCISTLAANRTHCPHGHPLDGTRKLGRRAGERYCMTCNRMAYYTRRAASPA